MNKTLNNIILAFIFCMGLYHIIPREFLFGRLIYYFSLYGFITYILLYFRSITSHKKYKRFYLIASIYSISKLFYHLFIAIFKYKFMILYLDSELFAAIYSGLIVFILVLFKLNNKL